nr:MAG: replication initiator protein [Microvirus sp.]
MRCLNPRPVGFQADGKTISWSQSTSSKEYAFFKLPCGKCIECRLEYARQWAVRCVHEAQMHEDNCFITLTYDEQHLESEKLDYTHFQKFMKRLRFANPNRQIGVFVTGEYGDQKKRPHWHACIFNWTPSDAAYKYTNERGDRAYTSNTLSTLWGKGNAEFGTVTFESAGYCARYAAKKLIHGRDDTHEYNPISKKSSKHAIGKSWIEKYWPDIFNYGQLHLPNGKTCSIPRYYEKWFKKNHPEKYSHYVTQTKLKKIEEAQKRKEKEELKEKEINLSRRPFVGPQIKKSDVRTKIINSKFEQLQKHLKL